MKVRCLISAPTAGQAFDLRCIVREKIIAFIQENYPEVLPQTRVTPLREFTEAGKEEPPEQLSEA